MKSALVFSKIALTLIGFGHCDRQWADDAAAQLMTYYDNNDGLWAHAWWTGANALTSIIDYMDLTGSRQYLDQVANTFEKARHHHGSWPESDDFLNEFIDDCGWWGLAWIRAFDLTGDRKYLDMAKTIADYMYEYHDNVCNGGLYWKNDKRNKNAIPNELYIKLAAAIYNRDNGAQQYLNNARDVWNWFKNTGMINGDNLINDGLKDLSSCQPDGATFTYNQGVILGGLLELNRATNDQSYLDQAVRIADAATTKLSPNGILREPGESDQCNNDGASFKGVFVRNLGELSRALGNKYHDYLVRNAQSAYDNDRSNGNQYGTHWAGPFVETGMSCQHSVLDLMNASL